MLAVNHDERRRRIAEVAADVIAQEGLDAATIRRISAELGCSTTIVTHYFSDKQDLLRWTYKFSAKKGYDRIGDVISRDPADIVSSLVAMTPFDEGSVRDWRVYLAFWDRAARDPSFAEEQRLDMEMAVSRIADVLKARVGEHADLDGAGRLLNALVHGISLQALLKREAWPEERIRRVLAYQVNSLLDAMNTASCALSAPSAEMPVQGADARA